MWKCYVDGGKPLFTVDNSDIIADELKANSDKPAVSKAEEELNKKLGLIPLKTKAQLRLSRQ